MKRKNRIFIGIVFILLAAGGIFWSVTQVIDVSPDPAMGPSEVIKIQVDHEGLYQVTAADMQRFGWENVDPNTLSLSASGSAQPFVVLGTGKDLKLVFYGRPPAAPFDRYTAQNAYFLSRDGAGLPPVEIPISTSTAGGAATVTAVRHFEENRIYNPRLEEGRPWFWLQLAAPGSQSVEFDLPDVAAGEAAFEFEWMGSTSSAEADPDHHLRILVNGTEIADEAWDGAGAHAITARFDAALLHAGANSLTFEAVGDTGVPADIILLDSVLLRYPQPFTGDEGRLAFIAAGEAVQSGEPVLLVNAGRKWTALDIVTGSGALPTIPGETYLAVFGESFETPHLLPASLDSDLRALPPADYVAIGSPELLEALQPLLAHRRSQGLTTLTVSSTAVYDQFGDGLALPHAIRAFLQFAQSEWETAPKYVLLVGDWSYDPHGYISPVIENGLPSFLIYTQYGGETVSDVEIAKLDGDDWPDVALGRLPARTAEQVSTVVKKIIAFETNPPAGGWTTRILAVADPTEASFRQDAETYLARFGAGFEPVLIAPGEGGAEASQDIENSLNAGVLLMSYFGHGSITQLGKDALFTAEQAAGLHNGANTPIMVNITCLAGLFTHPTIDSLSEAMLWNPGGGAVAALGATSLTLPFFQAYLSSGFAEALVSMPGARLGDMLLQAQRQVPTEDPGGKEVLDTFLLFGDPALNFPK